MEKNQLNKIHFFAARGRDFPTLAIGGKVIRKYKIQFKFSRNHGAEP